MMNLEKMKQRKRSKGRLKKGLLAFIKDEEKDIAKLMMYARERRVVEKVRNRIGVWL